MAKQKLNKNHELDLELIRQFGLPPQIPEGEDLSKIDFLTDEKVELISKINWELFAKMNESILGK